MRGPVLELHHPDGQVFRFDPGSLALAFAVTGTPAGDDRFETMRAPADVEQWAADVLGATEIRATEHDVEHALHLRAAIWHATDAVVDRRAVGRSDRRLLNAFAAAPSLAPQLTAGRQPSWSPAQSAAALFSTVARDAIDVVSGPLASRIRRCEGVGCSIPFVDTSRPGTRRWCSMERCGNRAKVSAHRRRHRQEVSR